MAHEREPAVQDALRSRVPTELHVRYGTATLDRRDLAGNISVGGLYLRTNDVCKAGTRLRLAIEFPDREVRMTAEVVWAIRVPSHLTDTLVHGMGLQFVGPGAEWREFFVAWKARVEGPAAPIGSAR